MFPILATLQEMSTDAERRYRNELENGIRGSDMERWAWAVAAGGGVALGTAAACAVGNYNWIRTIQDEVTRLYAAPPKAPRDRLSVEELRGLPAPVVRYFEFALTPGQPIPRRYSLTQKGEIRTGGVGSHWNPFTAVQVVSTDPPGFVWEARVRLALPLLGVRVQDSYIEGKGTGWVALASLIPLGAKSDIPELNAGSLHRILVEAVWFPRPFSRAGEWRGSRWTRGGRRPHSVTAGFQCRWNFSLESGARSSALTPPHVS